MYCVRGVVVQTFCLFEEIRFDLFFSVNLSIFRLIVRADVIVMNQGKSIFCFGFVFENDQLS